MNRRRFIALTAMAAAASHAREDGVDRIVCGQIGTGHAHAAGKMQAMRNLSDLYRVVGIAEPNEERWSRNSGNKAYAEIARLSLDEMLDSEAKVIAVETGIEDAPRMAKACLGSGKHVHLDKPGALGHAEFKELRLLAERKNLIVQMGYMLRYNPAFTLLFKAHREGWFGEVTSIDASMGKLADPGLRRELAKLPGGGMFELACHLTDAVVTLLGKPEDVTAFSTPVGNDTFKDNQLAVLSYPKATVTLRCNHTDPFGGPHRAFHVIGTRGSMEISPLESGNCILSFGEPQGTYQKGRNTLALEVPKGRYDAEFIDLAKAVRSNASIAWDAAHDVAVHETVLRSAGLNVN
jgi:predicted dehydrogenase